MKFAVVGAGAIGAFVGASLSASGEDVALVGRGRHLEAMQRHGVQVRLLTGETLRAFLLATDNPEDIGPVDAVLLAVKAQSLPSVAQALKPLLKSGTSIVAAQNGIPWWYFEDYGGSLAGTHLKAVDPDGYLSSAIPTRCVVGCVIYCSTAIVEPGIIEQIEGNRFAIGELDGSRSDRCLQIAQAFQKAGLKCAVRSRIRHDVWVKLIGNLAFNPVSALTRASMDEIVADPQGRVLVREIMEEGRAVARAVGMELDITTDQRLEGAARVGPHRTSSLQDIERGRAMEVDAIAGAVVELADILGVPVPRTRAVYACAKLLERQVLESSGSQSL